MTKASFTRLARDAKHIASSTTQSDRRPNPNWKEVLLLNSRKQPFGNLANAIAAFREAPEWHGVLGHDTFAHRTVALSAPPWMPATNAWAPVGWADRDDALATEWLQHHEIAAGLETTRAAVETVACGRQFHPVLDYLGGLVWDQRKRLDRLTSTYLGAVRTPYMETVGRCALIGAVARIKQPGCKLDTVPIIEGPQGIKKSSAIRVLGGLWFTDEIADFGSKDAAMQAASAWFIEIAELDAMSKAETSKVKAFISRTTDRFRPPFGRRVVESKRPSVFWGTTNSDQYLKDETGARRFWPIQAGKIDLDALARDRDQLFAEAVYLFDRGDPWWMTTADIELDARSEQRARYVADPWEEPVSRYAHQHENLSIREVLADVFNMADQEMDQRSQNRVAACLQQLDFERYRQRVPGRSSPEWRYRRTSTEADNATGRGNADPSL